MCNVQFFPVYSSVIIQEPYWCDGKTWEGRKCSTILWLSSSLLVCLCMGCDLQQFFSVLPPQLDESEKLEAGYSSSPTWKTGGNWGWVFSFPSLVIFFWGQVFLRKTNVLAVFQNGYFSVPLLEAHRYLTLIFTCRALGGKTQENDEGTTDWVHLVFNS